jgi:7-cyano-7-deazaguanine reductase
LPNCAASFELKSLKDYLFTYPKLGVFQENVVNPVLENVAKACEPVWAIVKGEFRARGGISATIEARWPRPRPRFWAVCLKLRRWSGDKRI